MEQKVLRGDQILIRGLDGILHEMRLLSVIESAVFAVTPKKYEALGDNDSAAPLHGYPAIDAFAFERDKVGSSDPRGLERLTA